MKAACGTNVGCCATTLRSGWHRGHNAALRLAQCASAPTAGRSCGGRQSRRCQGGGRSRRAAAAAALWMRGWDVERLMIILVVPGLSVRSCGRGDLADE